MKKFVMLLFFVLLISCTSKTVVDVKKPELIVFSPLENSVFEEGDQIILSFEAKNLSGYAKLTVDDGVTEKFESKKKSFTEFSPGTHRFFIELFDLEGKSLGVVKEIIILVKQKSKPEFTIVAPKENSEVENQNILLEFFIENINVDSVKVDIDSANPFDVKGSSYIIPELSLGKHKLTAELFNQGKNTGLKKSVFFKVIEKKLNIETAGRFEIRFPVEGYKAKGDLIALSLAMTNFSLGKNGDKNKPNEGHFHVFVDNSKTPLEADKATYTVKNLAKGRHTLVVEMVKNDHSSYELKKKVTFDAQVVTGGKD